MTHFNTALSRMNSECCGRNDAHDNCTTGVPKTCDVGCAIALHAMHSDCHTMMVALLGAKQPQFEGVYKSCLRLPVDTFNYMLHLSRCNGETRPLSRSRALCSRRSATEQ